MDIRNLLNKTNIEKYKKACEECGLILESENDDEIRYGIRLDKRTQVWLNNQTLTDTIDVITMLNISDINNLKKIPIVVWVDFFLDSNNEPCEHRPGPRKYFLFSELDSFKEEILNIMDCYYLYVKKCKLEENEKRKESIKMLFM